MQRPDADMVRAALKTKGKGAPTKKYVEFTLSVPFFYFADEEHMEKPWIKAFEDLDDPLWEEKIEVKPEEWMFPAMTYMFRSRGVLSRHTIEVHHRSDLNYDSRYDNLFHGDGSKELLKPDDYIISMQTWDTAVEKANPQNIKWLNNKRTKKLIKPASPTCVTSAFLVRDGKLLDPKWVQIYSKDYPFLATTNKPSETEQNLINQYIDSIHAFLLTIQAMHDYLKHSDKHPVEVTPIKQPKLSSLNKDKPWRRATGPRILFLDRMPTTQAESTGTHASPKPHRRRGHWRELSHPRYRHHPQYKQKIWVKPSFIGPEQTVYESNLYRLIKPLDELLAA